MTLKPEQLAVLQQTIFDFNRWNRILEKVSKRKTKRWVNVPDSRISFSIESHLVACHIIGRCSFHGSLQGVFYGLSCYLLGGGEV